MANDIRYFSMFTGIGGFELGLSPESANRPGTKSQSKDWRSQKGRHRAADKSRALFHGRQQSTLRSRRLRCVGFAEVDRFACHVLRYRFPTVRNFGNASTLDPRELPDFDLLCAGFPCQAFSIAGKRKGFGDSRGTLLFEIARVAGGRIYLVLSRSHDNKDRNESGDTQGENCHPRCCISFYVG